MNKIKEIFYPKLFSLINGNINKKQVFTDISSGIVVGIVALPLAIAFAIASGVTPDRGIITAIVAGLLISVLGGSRVQIGGPTGAFVIIILGIIKQSGIEGLFYSTLIAGFLLILFGLFKLGRLLKFIPHPLVVGFTSGIAIVIFSSQIKDALGLKIEHLPGEFIKKLAALFRNIGTINIYALAVALITVFIIILFRRKYPKIPGTFIALILMSLFVKVLNIPVTTIGMLYGKIELNISLNLPEFNANQILDYIRSGFIIALLGGIESLLSATVADGMISGHHRSNTELIGQGIANIITPFFGGIPATGAIARTAVNIQNGGRTPIAGIAHSVTLLFLLLFFKELIIFIPMSCLAGILIVVSFNMSEYKSFISILKGNNFDKLILLTTFFITVFFDLALAIEIGVVLSSILFMKRMTDFAEVNVVDNVDSDIIEMYPEIPEGLGVYEISGPFFFATARLYSDLICSKGKKKMALIIRMRHVSFMDQTGLHSFKDTLKILRHKGIVVILSGVNDGIKQKLEKNDIYLLIDKEDICDSFSSSIQRAESVIKAVME